MIEKLKLTFTIVMFTCFGSFLTAQVSIGTTTPDPSSIFDIDSNSKGLLIPRLTEAEREAIVNPAAALMIYNTTENCLQINTGTPSSPLWECQNGVKSDDNTVTIPSGLGLCSGFAQGIVTFGQSRMSTGRNYNDNSTNNVFHREPFLSNDNNVYDAIISDYYGYNTTGMPTASPVFATENKEWVDLLFVADQNAAKGGGGGWFPKGDGFVTALSSEGDLYMSSISKIRQQDGSFSYQSSTLLRSPAPFIIGAEGVFSNNSNKQYANLNPPTSEFFIPNKDVLNSVGEPLKFSYIMGSYTTATTGTTSGSRQVYIAALGTDGLVYTWGGGNYVFGSSIQATNVYQSRASTAILFRTTAVTDNLSSATPSPAEAINNMLSRNNTSILVHEKDYFASTTFFPTVSTSSSVEASAIASFVSKDGYLNLISALSIGNSKRIKLPGSTKVIRVHWNRNLTGIVGNEFSHALIIGDDGKVYFLDGTTATKNYTTQDEIINLTSADIYVDATGEGNVIDYFQATSIAENEYVLLDDGRVFRFDRSVGAAPFVLSSVAEDLHATKDLPLLTRFLGRIWGELGTNGHSYYAVGESTTNNIPIMFYMDDSGTFSSQSDKTKGYFSYGYQRNVDGEILPRGSFYSTLYSCIGL